MTPLGSTSKMRAFFGAAGGANPAKAFGMSTAVERVTWTATARDVVSLTKPRITLLVLLTAAGGMWLAPVPVPAIAILVMLVATGAVVSAANTLNCWLERDSDRFMRRTAVRPLPAGRLEPRFALGLGLALGAVSVPALTLLVNPMTGLLGAIALVSYVAVYTPMKQKSPLALLVGAVPGALPPLMGWTAATGTIDAPGLVLFGILFLWQIPHFIAIAIFRKDDYVRAGLKVLPAVRGDAIAWQNAALYAGVLLPVSLMLVPMGVVGLTYFVAALVLGVAYLGVALVGLRKSAGRRWARTLFFTSLVYLPLLCAALMLDAR